MADDDNKKTKDPSKDSQPNIPLEQAEAETVDSLSERLSNLEKSFDDQKTDSRKIIIGVLIASIFILLTVAVEVMLFHTRGNTTTTELQGEYYDKLDEVKTNFFKLEKEVETLRDSIEAKNASKS